jgi:hypothetical protein
LRTTGRGVREARGKDDITFEGTRVNSPYTMKRRIRRRRRRRRRSSSSSRKTMLLYVCSCGSVST